MEIFNLFILGILFLFLFIIFLILIKKNKKKNIKNIITEQKKNINQVDLYRQFAEECLLDSGIDLNNVYIAANTTGGIIFNFKNVFDFSYPCKDLKKDQYSYFGNKFKTNTVYIILPEINSLRDVWTWLHEIRHYMCKHLENDNREIVFHEYEAEKYAEAIIKLCPIEKGNHDYQNEYYTNIHNIYLESCINEAKEYVLEYLNKSKNEQTDLLVYSHINEYVNNKVTLYKKTC